MIPLFQFLFLLPKIVAIAVKDLFTPIISMIKITSQFISMINSLPIVVFYKTYSNPIKFIGQAVASIVGIMFYRPFRTVADLFPTVSDHRIAKINRDLNKLISVFSSGAVTRLLAIICTTISFFTVGAPSIFIASTIFSAIVGTIMDYKAYKHREDIRHALASARFVAENIPANSPLLETMQVVNPFSRKEKIQDHGLLKAFKETLKLTGVELINTIIMNYYGLTPFLFNVSVFVIGTKNFSNAYNKRKEIQTESQVMYGIEILKTANEINSINKLYSLIREPLTTKAAEEKEKIEQKYSNWEIFKRSINPLVYNKSLNMSEFDYAVMAISNCIEEKRGRRKVPLVEEVGDYLPNQPIRGVSPLVTQKQCFVPKVKVLMSRGGDRVFVK